MTSYLPSVVPTKPTSPRYGREQPLGQPLMRKLMRSSPSPSSSRRTVIWRMSPGSARSASATARPHLAHVGDAAVLDVDADVQPSVALLVPAEVVVDGAPAQALGRPEREAGPGLDLVAEPVEAAVRDRVLQPRV